MRSEQNFTVSLSSWHIKAFDLQVLPWITWRGSYVRHKALAHLLFAQKIVCLQMYRIVLSVQ